MVRARGTGGDGPVPQSPNVPERPGAGIGPSAVGELTVEAPTDRPAVEEPQFPASRE